MEAHVFIVDQNTFQFHLEYLFAGTGATDQCVPFLASMETNIHSTTERMLMGMLADVSKIRVGDKVIFYLQSSTHYPGMFFGVFEAASSVFFDENDSKNYLKDCLRKGLTFRILIKPYQVFENGITEHEYLDRLEGKTKPYQLCWSLIYRKLKGHRGCTMITEYEYEDLYQKLSFKNKVLLGNHFSFDSKKNKIVVSNHNYSYLGRQEKISVFPRLLWKATHKKAYETHLQAYLLENFDQDSIKKQLLPLNGENCWIGNEVSCGVGMQRIDLLIKQEDQNYIYLKVIELKDEIPTSDVIGQLSWYLEWISDYMIPNYLKSGKQIKMIPSIIAPASGEERIKKLKEASFENKNAKIEPLEYIAYRFVEGKIEFEKI